MTIAPWFRPQGRGQWAAIMPQQHHHTMRNTLYRRSESDWIGPSENKLAAGENYWRSQARRIFKDYPKVELIEIVHTGRMTDSTLIKRRKDAPPCDCYVIVASTGGKWGKSRRDFEPSTN